MNIPPFDSFSRVWFLSWTTYGTWLPGDRRGFVSPKFEGEITEPSNNVVGAPYDAARPELRRLAYSNLICPPIVLGSSRAFMLKNQFMETARFRGWVIVVGAVMATHLHLAVGVQDDPDPSSLMRDFKSYGSRSLNRAYGKPRSGTWWTEQGSKRKVKNGRHYLAVVKYVKDRETPLITWYGVQGADAPRSPGVD